MPLHKRSGTEDAQPSTFAGGYWLWAKRRHGRYPEHTECGGKWLVFVSVEDVYRWWATIKHAVEEGRLGGLAKVATALPNRHAVGEHERVICVYTYDGYDKEDAMRVREALRVLGVTWPVSYKPDSATRAGAYGSAEERASIYRV